MAKGKYSKKELKKLNTEDLFKIAERMKIAGFTKMDKDDLLDAILEAQDEGSTDSAADDVRDKLDAKEKETGGKKNKKKDAPKPSGGQVKLDYIGKGGSVATGGRKFRPGASYLLDEATAKAIKAKFPNRFKIRKA